MNLVVFGASGGVGKLFVQQAQSAGHSTRAVYRSTQQIPRDPDVEQVTLSDFSDAASLSRLVSGMDVVVSCLGPKRKDPKNPWSTPTTPLDFMGRFSAALVQTMTAAGTPSRLILISAAGVGSSEAVMSPVLKFVFQHSNVGVGYRDLAAMEANIQSSELDWCIVRPVTLTTGPLTGLERQCDRYKLMSSISRADVAHFMVGWVGAPNGTAKQAPMICSK